jgi:hypothetical protein
MIQGWFIFFWNGILLLGDRVVVQYYTIFLTRLNIFRCSKARVSHRSFKGYDCVLFPLIGFDLNSLVYPNSFSSTSFKTFIFLPKYFLQPTTGQSSVSLQLPQILQLFPMTDLEVNHLPQLI